MRKRLFLLSDIKRLNGDFFPEKYLPDKKIYAGTVIIENGKYPVWVKYDVFGNGYICGFHTKTYEEAREYYNKISIIYKNAIEEKEENKLQAITKKRVPLMLFYFAFSVILFIITLILLFSILANKGSPELIRKIIADVLVFIAAVLSIIESYQMMML